MGCINSKKDVPIVDPRLPVSYQQLNEEFSNDKNFINSLIEEGCGDFSKSIENMLEIVSAEGMVDLEQFKLHCHSIKGSAATLTCLRLSEMAKNLEDILESDKANSKIFIKHLNLMKTEIVEILDTKKI